MLIENSVLQQMRNSLANAQQRKESALKELASIEAEQAQAIKVFEERKALKQTEINGIDKEAQELQQIIAIIEAQLPKVPTPPDSAQ
ncbi:hypothetical protein CN367_11645 [Priestia megaterium]|uniref:hypothetical protein n=1 Tax=Priestia megaterium TaxID=1404 RepID=UPI000BF440B8|nr:hypothetical protein [Priestia megaterium]PEZ47017.1 hypothetical protein CN367_11645 [Priestia megaterium]